MIFIWKMGRIGVDSAKAALMRRISLSISSSDRAYAPNSETRQWELSSSGFSGPAEDCDLGERWRPFGVN